MSGEKICPFWTDDPSYCLNFWQWVLMIGLFVGCYVIIGLGRGWLMRATQMTIFLAVMGTNIQWHWTPNGLLAGLIATGAAYALTVWPGEVVDMWRRRSVLPIEPQPYVEPPPLPPPQPTIMTPRLTGKEYWRARLGLPPSPPGSAVTGAEPQPRIGAPRDGD